MAATAVAVWAGALGCVGLILRGRWATPLLIASLAGVIVQDVSLFVMSAQAQVPAAAFVLQGLVLLIAVALVLLARRATARGWLTWTAAGGAGAEPSPAPARTRPRGPASSRP